MSPCIVACRRPCSCRLAWPRPVVAPQVRVAASVITVTTTADGVVADDLCSLREAVISANTDQAVGGCEAGSGTDTIVVSPALPLPATFVLDTVGAGEDGAVTGDLDIAGNVTIQGAGFGSDHSRR